MNTLFLIFRTKYQLTFFPLITKLYLLFLLAFPLYASGEDAKKLTDKKFGLDAFVITIAKKNNQNFTVIDVPHKKKNDTVLSYWNRKKYQLMINAGFFDPNFKPVGFYKLNGKIINKNVSKKLSGLISIDLNGKINLLTKKDDFKKYPTVIQTGPYLIDPGSSIERLLNLDGGPSTALKTDSLEILNRWPVRNYIGKKGM